MRKIAIGGGKGECPLMRGVLACLLVLLAFRTLPAWESTLSPEAPGPHAEVAPFEGEFRFGWSEIDAARVNAVVSYREDRALLKATGGTEGLARALYQLDIEYSGEADRVSLQTVSSELVERYVDRTVTESVRGNGGTISSFRATDPPGQNPPKWKVVKVSPIRDLWAAMLFIRSQPLAVGETVRVLVFPGGSPYLVDIVPVGVESLEVMGARHDALKLDVKIQHVNTKKGNALEPHGKFRSGKIWLTADAGRMPLRAEVDIFIGYVFAEVVSIKPMQGGAK